MRTPWRFLSDLVSRKAPEGQEVESREKALKVIAIEHRPVEDETIANAGPGGSTTVENGIGTVVRAPGPVASEAVMPADLASENAEQTVALTDAQNAVAIEDTNEIGLDRSTNPLVSDSAEDGSVVLTTTAKPERIKRPQKANAAQVPTTPPKEDDSTNAWAARTIEEEIVQLDQEISELRRHLSEKLVIQNTQLKRLLDRYQD